VYIRPWRIEDLFLRHHRRRRYTVIFWHCGFADGRHVNKKIKKKKSYCRLLVNRTCKVNIRHRYSFSLIGGPKFGPGGRQQWEKKILDFNWKLVFLDLTPKMRTRWIHLSPAVSAECVWKNTTPRRTHFRNHKFTLLTFRRGDVSFLRCFW